jgi:hypothetical protein
MPEPYNDTGIGLKKSQRACLDTLNRAVAAPVRHSSAVEGLISRPSGNWALAGQMTRFRTRAADPVAKQKG